MTSYSALSTWYNELTKDIPYPSFIHYYERAFLKHSGDFQLILDLCCGTGTLSKCLSKRGYDVIAVDESEEMLMVARGEMGGLSNPPLLICQKAQDLDLFGTVDAAICALDSLNYIPPDDINRVFQRLRLFIRPGGLFLFDIKTPDSFISLDGQTFVDERENIICIWQANLLHDRKAICYDMDLFTNQGNDLWKKETEEHIEYLYSPEELQSLLLMNGFIPDNENTEDTPQKDEGRMFFTCERSD